MFPLETLNLRLRQALQLLAHVQRVAPLVVRIHPEQGDRSHDQGHRRGGQVEPVADRVVGPVPAEVRPGSHEPPDVAEHDVGGQGHAAGRVADDLGRRLRVGQRSGREAADGREEGRRVPHPGVGAGQEHDVAHHRQERDRDEEYLPLVQPPAQQREEELEHGPDHVRRYRVELLLHGGVRWEDAGYDGGREER